MPLAQPEEKRACSTSFSYGFNPVRYGESIDYGGEQMLRENDESKVIVLFNHHNRCCGNKTMSHRYRSSSFRMSALQVAVAADCLPLR